MNQIIRIAVIEDDWVDLLKIWANFAVANDPTEKAQIFPYLFHPTSIPTPGEISDYQKKVSKSYPGATFPPYKTLPAVSPIESTSREQILSQLIEDDIDVIISDSNMDRNDAAGAFLLHGALTDPVSALRRWTCYLTTKHFHASSRFHYQRQDGTVDARIRYIDKTDMISASPDECCSAISDMLDLEGEKRRRSEAARERKAFGRFKGASKLLTGGRTSVYGLMDIVAENTAGVLITGETGTGKDVAALSIHEASSRSREPFIKHNCAQGNDEMSDSLLFGHKRGAFTGAIADHDGLIVGAKNGTLFLNEIGEMPLKQQAKLLDVLEDKRVRPLGAVRDEKVNFRLIAATNRNLEQMVSDGTFREDLLYRLSAYRIALPPLRDHPEDIPQLALDLLLLEVSPLYQGCRFTLTPGAMELLCQKEWRKGNVRELRITLMRAAGFVYSKGQTDCVIAKAEIADALHRAENQSSDNGMPHQSALAGAVRAPISAEMSNDEICAGLVAGRLARISAGDLASKITARRRDEVYFLADRALHRMSPRARRELFPGTPDATFRKIEERKRKADAARA